MADNNNNNKKLVFFDIDNTIWDIDNRIPKSTVAAIRALRRNGHLAFLCSGRCRGYIRAPALLDIGFDGIISGCGTLIEYGEKTLFYHRIEPALAEWAVKTVRSYGFRPILEGREHLYFDDSEFAGDFYGEKLRREIGDRLRSIEGCWGGWEISKFACDTRGADREGCFAALQKDFDLIIHDQNVVEVVPKGFDKGDGIRRLCGMIGRDIADTVAFGDSVNDLGMFAACGVAVCMGNGVGAAKEAADLVTAPLDEDGIWKGCRTLGLI